MKMFGSKFDDTLIGTGRDDTIKAGRGDDLIDGNGGRDIILAGSGDDLISGFSANLKNLRASPSRGCHIDGGSGSDDLILDITPATRISMLQSATNVMNVKGIEEIIYNVGATSSKQQIAGTDRQETICTGGTANVRGMGGADYIFSQDGDDILSGGDGDDYLSAGAGHNTVTGGAGADHFAFDFQGAYQYTEVTDFDVRRDHIAIIIAPDQYNILTGVAAVPLTPTEPHGDGVQSVGGSINEYVSYDNGRFIGAGDFDRANDRNSFENFVTYDRSTGSVLLNYFKDDGDGGVDKYRVLLAHLDGSPKLDMDHFEFLVM